MDEVDHTEVNRKAHELEAAHGQDGARRYAWKLAQDAMDEGGSKEHAFWRSVALSLTIR